MDHEYYYMIEIEEYNIKTEKLIYTENVGLFSSFISASEYLISEGFEVYCDEFLGNYYLGFHIPNGECGVDAYHAYINKYEIIK